MSTLESRVRLWYNDDVASLAILAIDTTPGSSFFTVTGDRTTDFPVGDKLRIYGSTANDGEYAVVSSVYGGLTTNVFTVADLSASAVLGYANIHAIVAATIATSTFRITGDWTLTFPVDRNFSVVQSAGNNSGHVVVSVTFTSSGAGSAYACGHTDIVVNSTVLDATADGYIERYDNFTYDMGGNVLPDYSLPGQRDTDRLGLTHRIMPTTNFARFVNTISLFIPDFEIDQSSTENNLLADFFKTHSILADHDLEVFSEQISVDKDGDAYSHKRAYKVKMEDLPPWIYSNQAMLDDGSNDMTLEMFSVQDGIFGDWDEITSTTYRTKPT